MRLQLASSHFSDWRREPRAVGGPRLHSLSRRPIRRSSAGENYPEISRAEQQLEGLSFFSFPGVTSPNRFKQLYRSRMNSIELMDEQRAAVLQEAVDAFEFNIQVRKEGLKS